MSLDVLSWLFTIKRLKNQLHEMSKVKELADKGLSDIQISERMGIGRRTARRRKVTYDYILENIAEVKEDLKEISKTLNEDWSHER